ncbi:MAG: hypothetical protein KGP27_05800, partial [Hyphomicrobiales bacterium]|nr:hypothetical protein [Hyphomicrobiales bacterium]
GDADGFLNAALDWFQYRGKPIKGNERGRALAKLIRQKRTLVVLDGLEPLQYPAHSPGKEGSLRVTGLEGQQKDHSIAELIKALADQMHGLVVITTRIPIPELKTRTEPAVVRRALNQLSTDAGVTLLRLLKVKADEQDLRETVELLKEHALSLNLLATYSTKRLRGLLPVRKEIQDLIVDENLGNHSYVMMRRYEILLEDRARETRGGPEASLAGRELALLYIIGLFDRPAEPDALAALKREPIAGLTDTFESWEGGRWDYTVAALRDLKLLLPEGAPGEIDAHPLVREYFGRRLRITRPEAFRAANLRLYEHYKLKDIPATYHDPVRYGLLALAGARGPDSFNRWLEALLQGAFPEDRKFLLPPVLRSITPHELRETISQLDDASFQAALKAALPDNVKAMDPLFAAISHGCAAVEHDAAFYEIYWPRWAHGNEGYAIRRFGAFGAGLSAIANFFEAPFSTPAEGLAESDRALLLGEAAFFLRALGRLTEAIVPLETGLVRRIASEDWHNAAINAANLSQVRLSIGNIGGAIAAATESVRYADAMDQMIQDQPFERLVNRCTLADALLQSGQLDEAYQRHLEAEAMQIEWRPSEPRLYSVHGYHYRELLLLQGKFEEVLERADYAIEIDRTGAILSQGLDRLSKGQGALMAGRSAQAAQEIEEAVALLESAGSMHQMPRAYLARAILHRQSGAFDLASADLDAIDDIAERSALTLVRIESALERARLQLARDGSAGCVAAASLVAKAKSLIETTRSRDHDGAERIYLRPAPDIALLEARMAVLSGKTADAPKPLAAAKHWIDKGWKIHERDHAELSAAISNGGFASARPSPKPVDANVMTTLWRKLFG